MEGNHYFPPGSVKREYLQETEYHSTCHWKGLASYYDIVVGDKVNKDAAWYYPQPNEGATHLKDHVAFPKGVEVE